MTIILIFSLLFFMNAFVAYVIYISESYKISLLNVFACGLSFAVIINEILN